MTGRRRLDPDDVRAIALALPEAKEQSHMGHPDFRVRNKIFATLTPDGLWTNMKTTPENLDALVAADPLTFRAIWGGRYLGIDLARVDVRALRALILEAWTLTAPKTLVATHRRSRPDRG